MTLVAKTKQPPHSKKRYGNHHRRSKTYHKPYWPYLPVVAIAGLGLLLNLAWPARHNGVLAYATDMSIARLVDDTNTQRASNSLGGLSENSLLDQAAQNKANDMVARDYWSHTTPDGQSPWTFYAAVGYSFQTAGENLAYGFSDADSTVIAWMNSPEHRANILNNTYQEVGFGVANSPNYQGTGPETIVVAEYASPVAGAAVASAPPATSSKAAAGISNLSAVPATTPAPAAATSTEPAPSATTIPQSANTQSLDSSGAGQLQQTSIPDKLQPITEATPQSIKQLQELTGGNVSWSMGAVSLLLVAGLALFMLRHSLAWHKVLRKGERFVLHHPWYDSALAAAVVILLLVSRTTGFIR